MRKYLTPNEEFEVRKVRKKCLIVLGASCTASIIIGGVLGGVIVHNKYKMYDDPNVQKIVEAYTLMVDDWYFGGDNIETDVTNSAISGMSAQGDRYTFYTTTQADQNLDTTQEGIGFKYTYYGGNLYVNYIYENTPCIDAGLKIGDVITASFVNDNWVSLVDCTVQESYAAVLNSSSSTVKYKVIDNSTKLEKEVSFTKGNYTYAGAKISSSRVDENGKLIVSLQVDTFIDKYLSSRVNLLLRNVMSIYDQDIDKLIIDLRGNGGGYVDQSIALAGLFIPKGSVVLQYLYKDGSIKTCKTTSAPYFSSIKKFVILEDKGTASASETFTLCMMNNDFTRLKTTVVGQTSYGKGIIQDLKYFSDGTVLRYTVAKSQYPTANGAICIHGIGITPDDNYNNCFYYFGEANMALYSSEELALAQTTIISEINLVLGTSYALYDEAITAYQTAKGLSEQPLNQETARYLQKEIYDYYLNGIAQHISNY